MLVGRWCGKRGEAYAVPNKMRAGGSTAEVTKKSTVRNGATSRASHAEMAIRVMIGLVTKGNAESPLNEEKGVGKAALWERMQKGEGKGSMNRHFKVKGAAVKGEAEYDMDRTYRFLEGDAESTMNEKYREGEAEEGKKGKETILVAKERLSSR
jgi:hypothetical protein